jgi:tetratricopeptide (TPR) repeat protein
MALSKLIGELHRRSLWQVIAGYLVFVWLLFETFEVLSVSVGLPAWVEPTAAVLLIVLFPALLATASIQRGPKAAWPRLTSDSTPEATPEPTVAATGPAPAPEARRPRAPLTAARMFTWRNTVAAGLGSFALLAVITAVYMVLRTAGIGPAATLVAQGTLADQERLILADFASPPALADLATTITEGMRLDLAQSPTVRIHSPRAVGAALARMEMEPDAVLSLDLAREVAVREDVRGVVAGEISQVGSGFVLRAEVVNADDGSVMISQRANARNEGQIVEAVDELSKKIRERIGEPLASIGRSERLERVTTADLEALRLYSSAIRAIDVEGADDRGQLLLEEALARDSTFAMAWRKLGVVLNNRGEERGRVYQALEQAFNYRDRLTARERDLATAAYYANATGETDLAIQAYQSLLEREPNEGTALNNLGVLMLELRDEAAAIPLLMRALEVDSTAAIPFMNMIWAYGNQGDFTAATEHIEMYPWLIGDPTAREHEAQLWASVGEYDQAQRFLEELRVDQVASPYWRTQTSEELATIAAVQGRLEEAERHFRDAMATNVERGLRRAAIVEATALARMLLHVTGDTPGALTTVDFALMSHPLEELDPLDRPYLDLAEVYAAAGRVERAQDLVDQFVALVPAEFHSADQRTRLDRVVGAIALASGDAQTAIEHTLSSDAFVCKVCALPQLARAYEAAGQRDSAIAAYSRYVETPYIFRTRDSDGWHLGPVLERLAELYEAEGSDEQAVEKYMRLARLWEDADDRLQSRVANARERAQALLSKSE